MLHSLSVTHSHGRPGDKSMPQVSPEATWSSKQHRLRWVLPAVAAGDRGDLKAQFLPDAKADPLAAAGVLEGAAGVLCRHACASLSCNAAAPCGCMIAGGRALQRCVSTNVRYSLQLYSFRSQRAVHQSAVHAFVG